MDNNQKIQIPAIGLGTHRIDEGEKRLDEIIEKAWSCGYRMFDTAQGYGNEQRLGIALGHLHVKRSEYFLISKLDDIYRDEASVRCAVERSLNDLGTDYIDLFLIHSPNSIRMKNVALEQGNPDDNYWEAMNQSTWAVMEDLLRTGIFRKIGVSNFHIRHLNSLLKTATVKPELNQIKMCIGSRAAQDSLLKVCEKEQIAVMGYSPLGKGNSLTHPLILKVAEKYGRTPAQIVLRSLLEKGIIPIVRAASEVHMKQNIDLFDFTMEIEDCRALDHIVIDENWVMIKDPDTQEKYNKEKIDESLDGRTSFLS